MEEKFTSHRAWATTAAVCGLIVCVLLFHVSEGRAQAIVPYKSNWKYLHNGVVQTNNAWRTAAFDDSGWPSGNGAFGFGTFSGNSYTTLLNRSAAVGSDNYPVYYFRKTVNVADIADYGSLRLRATLDDGIIIYFNGVEVARKNMTPTSNNYAGSPVGTPLLTIDTLLTSSVLQNGVNIIAVELHQTGATSSDVFFDLELQPLALFRYPYLQLASHNQMTVRWYTNLPANATVRYSTDADLENYKEVSSTLVDTLHSILLENLIPDTKYYYNVGYKVNGNEFRQLQYNPAVNHFRTLHSPADKSHSLRFWLLGDSGAGTKKNPRPIKVRDAYLAYLNSQKNAEVDGILFLGDNSNTAPYEGLQPALDSTLFRYYNNVADKQLLSYIPSWTVIGNHDYDFDPSYLHTDGNRYFVRKAYNKLTAASFSTFAFPDKGEIGGEPSNSQKGYYSFDQGDTHFVVLNPPLIESDDPSGNWVEFFLETDGRRLYNLYSKNSIALDKDFDTPIENLPQVKWLIKDLQNTTKKWTVVTFHLPPFSTIGHFPDEYDMKRVRERLLPLLEKPEYHVDALIVSHSHAYLRAGMIRKKGTLDRTTDYEQTGGMTGNGNLGRYPATKPYIKSNAETAYTYVLSGSAGRGWFNPNNTAENDAGFPTNASVQHPSTSVPMLDNLTGDNSTDFYHLKGGSVELFFQENRLDIKFIKESDTAPGFVVADSFVVMKDVNKKSTTTIQNGGDQVKLKASWIGDYKWTSAQQPSQVLTTGIRELTLGPNSSNTFYVRDQAGYMADTFIINVNNPKPVIDSETLIPFGSQWLLPLLVGSSTKSYKMEEQCIAPWAANSFPFEYPGKTIIGFGHNDESYKLHGSYLYRVYVPSERVWFRRSFILNGSTLTYANFKFTLVQDKILPGRKYYYPSPPTILINGKAPTVQNVATRDLGNGREELTYTLANNGFSYGINYILVSYYLTPISAQIDVDPITDPFTFDAQLVSTALPQAPPPATRQFRIATATLGSNQVCAGDTVSVHFTALGNESGFPLVYEAQLVTPTGDIPLAEGSQSPIAVTLPRDLKGGSYKMKLATKSAFMGELESAELLVRGLPKATIAPDTSISLWKGQSFAMPVKFEGTGPWGYTLPNGQKGTAAAADTLFAIRVDSSGAYSLRAVSNTCGAGLVAGSVRVEVKEPILAVGKIQRLTAAPLKTALCDGDSVSVAFSIIGPEKERTYAVEISDVNGSFNMPVALASGTKSPVAFRLPASLTESEKYRMRVKALNPDLDFTFNSSDALDIRKSSVGNFTLSKEAVLENEALKLNLVLGGSRPVYYYLRYGADTLSATTSQGVIERTLALRQTTVFSLDTVRNVCGYGLVSGNRTVTVSLLVGFDPFTLRGVTAYPNPASQLLILKNSRAWNGQLKWVIYGANGKVMHQGSGKPSPNVPFTIDISPLPAGLYILGLMEGRQEGAWKFVKK